MASAEADKQIPTDDSGGIAVLACDDFYYPNASFAFTAETCLEALQDCGIPAEIMGPEDLGDPKRFNPQRCPALLQIYGDAYPEPSLPHLRRYHQAGGCIISNGVPYGFACRRTKRGWQGAFVPEERSPRRHDGIGTGLWTKIDPVVRVRRSVSPVENPIKARLEGGKGSFCPVQTGLEGGKAGPFGQIGRA